MADGEHVKEKKLVGSYYGLKSRALIVLIKDKLGLTLKDMMDRMIVDLGVEAGLLNSDGSVRDDMVAVVDGAMEMVACLDNERSGTRTKKGISQ